MPFWSWITVEIQWKMIWNGLNLRLQKCCTVSRKTMRCHMKSGSQYRWSRKKRWYPQNTTITKQRHYGRCSYRQVMRRDRRSHGDMTSKARRFRWSPQIWRQDTFRRRRSVRMMELLGNSWKAISLFQSALLGQKTAGSRKKCSSL